MSVRAQTLRAWDLFLAHVGAPSDAVRLLLSQAAASDDRITVIERAANVGVVASSYDAVRAARGQFLAFLAYNDRLLPPPLPPTHHARCDSPTAAYSHRDADHANADGRLAHVPPNS